MKRLEFGWNFNKDFSLSITIVPVYGIALTLGWVEAFMTWNPDFEQNSER